MSDKETQIHEGLLGSDALHSAARYLARQFSLEMTRAEAQSNVTARVILANLQSAVLDDAFGLSGLTEAGEQVELRVVRRVKRGDRR